VVWTQRADGRHADWALPDDAVGVTAAVVSLDEAELESDDERRPRCPVCGIPAPMLAAATSRGERYDLCPGCGLLWHVDRKRGVVVGIRWGASRDGGGP
jgi:formate dehydrogenase maturation protein FdhE